MDISGPEKAFQAAQRRMGNAVEHIRSELTSVRAGRASVGILDSVQVEAYGSRVPLNQVASLSVPESTLIVANPFDPSQIAPIERAIRNANLGLNPSSDGKVVRIPVPPLTEERRKELSKLVHKLTEDGRNGVRQIRREINDGLKTLLKEHQIGEDDEHHALDKIQKITDQHVRNIDDLQKSKDDELLQH
jgi:ribosome recycling factor